MNSELLLLAGYSVAIIAASLLGGWLPGLVHMTHTRTQLMMSLVSGLMLGVALLHLFPQALLEMSDPHAVETAVWWMLLGIMFMLVLLRLFHSHRHDFSAEDDGPRGDADRHRPLAHPLSWLGITLGMGLHTLIEAVALGTSVRSEWSQGEGETWAGMAVFLAIFLHKPLDALSITGLMQAGGWHQRARTLANVGFALLWPLGILLFFWGMIQVQSYEARIVARAMAFSTGAQILEYQLRYPTISKVCCPRSNCTRR